jgi:hypothetical protein
VRTARGRCDSRHARLAETEQDEPAQLPLTRELSQLRGLTLDGQVTLDNWIKGDDWRGDPK